MTYSGVQGASGDDGDHDYRGEDYASVDIVGGGTGKAIGYTAADEWLEYTINVTKDGEYDIAANVSNGTSAGKLELSLDGKALASLSFTGVEGDWDTYELATGKATLTAGEHVLRITIANDNTNVDYVKFSLEGAGEDDPPLAINADLRLGNTAKTLQVFDMQGKFVGLVHVAAGTSVNDAVKARFQSAGVYMVKQGSKMHRIAVK